MPGRVKRDKMMELVDSYGARRLRRMRIDAMAIWRRSVMKGARGAVWVLAVTVVAALALLFPGSGTALAGNWTPLTAGGFGDPGNREILVGPV